MIQLGYFASAQQTQQDESLDFDPNYDPSDFLIKKDSTGEEEPIPTQQYQEPYEFAANIAEGIGGDEIQQPEGYYGSFAQQAFNVSDFGFQQPQQMSQEDYSQPQQQQQLMIPSDGGGLADLEISDSEDEEEPNEEIDMSQNQPDTSKEDDDGLWF
jgi:hypothetical protein